MRTLKPKTNKQLAVIRSSCFYILMPAHRAHALLSPSPSPPLSLPPILPLPLSVPDPRYFSCRRMPVNVVHEFPVWSSRNRASKFSPSRFRVSLPPFREPSNLFNLTPPVENTRTRFEYPRIETRVSISGAAIYKTPSSPRGEEGFRSGRSYGLPSIWEWSKFLEEDRRRLRLDHGEEISPEWR